MLAAVAGEETEAIHVVVSVVAGQVVRVVSIGGSNIGQLVDVNEPDVVEYVLVYCYLF